MRKYVMYLKEQLKKIATHSVFDKETRVNTLFVERADVMWVIDQLYELDEPEVLSQELPSIPEFVADWIEEAKGRHHSLYEAMAEYCSPEMNQWIQDFYHSDLFAKAWLNGYVVDKSPEYVIQSKEETTLYLEAYELGSGGHENWTNKDNCWWTRDRSRAEAVAYLVDGKIEELEE